MQATAVSARVAYRLAALSADYREAKGTPFQHFLCPMLYRDEDVELCEAHIVNQSFGASSQWTVQRKDIDCFYGSVFESDFVVLKDRARTIDEVLDDRVLSKRLNPTIEVNGRKVDYYAVRGPVPKEHSRLNMALPSGNSDFALKMSPADVAALANADWRVQMVMDIRVPAVVSLLKAAHLTLFHLLGYQYALSAGGVFLGRDILGKFFESHVGQPKRTIVESARDYFREFAQMVRPVGGIPDTFKGTVEDSELYICERGVLRWGLIVFIRTAPDSASAVLVPYFADPVSAKVFLDFLNGSEDQEITVRKVRFRGDHWGAATDTMSYRWPRIGTSYSD